MSGKEINKTCAVKKSISKIPNKTSLKSSTKSSNFGSSFVNCPSCKKQIYLSLMNFHLDNECLQLNCNIEIHDKNFIPFIYYQKRKSTVNKSPVNME